MRQADAPRLPVDEAARYLLNCFTREYRKRCLDSWRQLHGDEYADAVEREVRARWKKSK